MPLSSGSILHENPPLKKSEALKKVKSKVISSDNIFLASGEHANTAAKDINTTQTKNPDINMSGSAVQREETPAANNAAANAGKKRYKSWDQLTPKEQELRGKFRNWVFSFVRLDPRYRIHRFFQGIAQRGELKLQDKEWQKKKRASLKEEGSEGLDVRSSLVRLQMRERELLCSCFNMASMFSVWRPCSNDAIRKMMQGLGVGKGLDIKGKSAKFGRCSGYVPFLQIHNPEDKKKIDLLPRDARMRIFYTSEETRQLAVDVLEKVRDEMVETVDVDEDSMTLLRFSFADPGAGRPSTVLLTDQNTSSTFSILGSRESMAMSAARDRMRTDRRDSYASLTSHGSEGSLSSYPRTISPPPSREQITPITAKVSARTSMKRRGRLERVKSMDDDPWGLSVVGNRERQSTASRPAKLKLRSSKSDATSRRKPRRLMTTNSLSPRRRREILPTVDSFALRGDDCGDLATVPVVERSLNTIDSGETVLSEGADYLTDLSTGRSRVSMKIPTGIPFNMPGWMNKDSRESSTSLNSLPPLPGSKAKEPYFSKTSKDESDLMSKSTPGRYSRRDGRPFAQSERGPVAFSGSSHSKGSNGDAKESSKSRRHSLGGESPAEIALKHRDSSTGSLTSLGSTGSTEQITPKTTKSVATTSTRLLAKNSSRRSTSSVMEYCVASQRRQAWEMSDPTITLIDDYVEDGRFGIEIAERLFWEALVMRQENHCQRWNLMHPKDEKHDNKNNDVYDPDSSDTNTTRQPKDNFAQKLMKQLVAVSEKDPDNSVIEWVHEDGSWSFVIVDKTRFVQEVLFPIRRKDEENQIQDAVFPTKYSSFSGELRRCKFTEETTGTGIARFHHQLFRKDQPEFCALIGSEHDTGRGSVSSLQDANFKALRHKAASTGGHEKRVVLYNLEDENNPLCPHNLLMAYEEHGQVKPVVSDFDGFLVGTKRIHYDRELPKEQVEILEGSILSAQEILEGNAMGDTWAEKWAYASRDHLGQNNSRINGKKKPKMPQFGYGDPKSYRLMEGAVAQLAKQDGAVRHGAECFNYAHPQEIDQSFLIISDKTTLDGRVRWKYVDSVKLHYFLEKRIGDGYTFPLSPKWVLCDPGWSKLYDKLLQSKDANVQESLKVWFPPKIREMIQQINSKHPRGLRFEAPGKGPTKGKMGLPCIAKYSLGARKGNGPTLFIDRGSVLLFSKPELRTALVCATNESCVPICGGVTQALTGAGGLELFQDAQALPVLWESSFGPVRCVTGSAKIVSRKDGKNYGNLDVNHVIFAVGPAYGETYTSDNDVGISDGLLKNAYRQSMQCAKDNGLECVAFSLLSAGKRSSRWDPHRALRLALRAISDYEDYGSLKEIHMCAFTAAEVAALENIAKAFGL